jgi:hypothetical protein
LISSSGICGEIFSKIESTSNRCLVFIFHPFRAEYYHKQDARKWAIIKAIKNQHVFLAILKGYKFFRNSLY